MIIGIDGNEANVEKRVGIGEYAFELIKNFEQFKTDINFVIYLKEKPREDLPKPRIGFEYRIVGPKKLWTQLGLPFDLLFHKPRPDVFFTPSHYSPRFSPVKTAISIMDLSYIYYPQLFRKEDLYQLIHWTKYSAIKSSKIFTISRASKDDIIKVYKVQEDKVVVTYPGIKQMTDKTLQKDKNSGQYILFVGTLQPRKNIVKLIEAYSKINTDLRLLIVGKKGWIFDEILSAPKKYGVSEKVEFLDFVKDDEMADLYKNALCFVLPSLYEGFGLPVLEAMKNGCPVIISNVSSLPEAGGDAALYFDPENVDDIQKTIEKVISNENLRKEMIKKGYAQVKKFSWEKTARETLKVLEEVANER